MIIQTKQENQNEIMIYMNSLYITTIKLELETIDEYGEVIHFLTKDKDKYYNFNTELESHFSTLTISEIFNSLKKFLLKSDFENKLLIMNVLDKFLLLNIEFSYKNILVHNKSLVIYLNESNNQLFSFVIDYNPFLSKSFTRIKYYDSSSYDYISFSFKENKESLKNRFINKKDIYDFLNKSYECIDSKDSFNIVDENHFDIIKLELELLKLI